MHYRRLYLDSQITANLGHCFVAPQILLANRVSSLILNLQSLILEIQDTLYLIHVITTGLFSQVAATSIARG